MTVPVCTFFNNKGGVGKTTLVYHLAWMFAEKGLRVVVVDLDPQSNLTAAFFDEEDMEELWRLESGATVASALRPLLTGTGGLDRAHITEVTPELGVVVGDLSLSTFEDELAQQWPHCLDGKERAFRIIGAFWQVISWAAEDWSADLVLVDVGPNLGSLNRAAMVASDHVLVPVGADLFSLQGLRNLGPTLRRWRTEWADRLDRRPDGIGDLPRGSMQPIGYVVAQHGVRLDRPVRAYRKWAERIPAEFHRSVMGESSSISANGPEDDPECLALLKHYHSLIPLAQEARKPVFLLRAADGALGAHLRAVGLAYADFNSLAEDFLERVGVAGSV